MNLMYVKNIDFYSPQASKLFADSLKETGFAVLKNHPLSTRLIEYIEHEWRAFFHSSNVDKYLYREQEHDGFFPQNISEIAKNHANKDLKCYYHLYFPWGRYPEEVSGAARDYFHQVLNLGAQILKWIDDHKKPAVSKRLDEALPEIISKERTLLRILNYPPLTSNQPEGAIRAATHEDINLITILPISQEPGLQVYDRQKDQWFEVHGKKHDLVINIGDMLQEMTDFEYISTSHRVVNPSKAHAHKDRIAMPTFIHPRSDVFLSPRYPRADDYLQERLQMLGLKS